MLLSLFVYLMQLLSYMLWRTKMFNDFLIGKLQVDFISSQFMYHTLYIVEVFIT